MQCNTIQYNALFHTSLLQQIKKMFVGLVILKLLIYLMSNLNHIHSNDGNT